MEVTHIALLHADFASFFYYAEIIIDGCWIEERISFPLRVSTINCDSSLHFCGIMNKSTCILLFQIKNHHNAEICKKYIAQWLIHPPGPGSLTLSVLFLLILCIWPTNEYNLNSSISCPSFAPLQLTLL